ncbi:hypothetical protein PROFUN_02251 [Planoprotostelium fungivorum]|uniref:Protein RFT1 homolog n=1 Tax=Planoprotostelium fungivorum TaxID=1890364 RepID=A0A2P6NYE1_9EUKA|nr:hypothetical protein PROFUN_02251 [Planoprotostelium fungivorum]
MSSDAGKGQALGWMAGFMLVQAITRAFHFILNFLLISFLSPEDLGLSSLQLPLVTMIMTRIAKEALHRAAVREQGEKGKNNMMVLVWWSIPVTILLSSLLCWSFVHSSLVVKENPWMVRGLICWLISSWLELAVEPVIIYLESCLVINVTVAVEVISLAVHGVATFLMLYYGERYLVQSYGQLLFTLCSFVGYYIYALSQRDVWTKIWPSSFRLNQEMWEVQGFVTQSIGKYFTAEGERGILFWVGTPQQQAPWPSWQGASLGTFEFVNNLGSIVARIIFLPIEKTAFVMFSKQKGSSESDVNQRKQMWTMLLTMSTFISLTYLSTCYNYIHLLVHLAYGPKWSSSNAPDLLALYGVYLLLIGVNGLVEALRDSVASTEKIKQQARYTFAIVAFYVLQGCLLTYYLGEGGLILASCLSVVQRIIFNVRFFPSEVFPLSLGLPETKTSAMFLFLFVSGYVTRTILGPHNIKLLGFGVAQGESPSSDRNMTMMDDM